jgi:hypothetical protein
MEEHRGVLIDRLALSALNLQTISNSRGCAGGAAAAQRRL